MLEPIGVICVARHVVVNPLAEFVHPFGHEAIVLIAEGRISRVYRAECKSPNLVGIVGLIFGQVVIPAIRPFPTRGPKRRTPQRPELAIGVISGFECVVGVGFIHKTQRGKGCRVIG